MVEDFKVPELKDIIFVPNFQCSQSKGYHKCINFTVLSQLKIMKKFGPNMMKQKFKQVNLYLN